jgi:radical SAM-linked protein
MTHEKTEPITARVEYAKLGRLRFIGHLDTARLITRAVRAARLPVRTTQGHSPHVEASFGPPLPLGTTGGAEFFDLRLTETVDAEAAREALAVRLPEGLEVRAVRLMAGRPASLAAWLDRADYTLRLPAGFELPAGAIERFLASERAVVVRQRGGRDKEVNVRRYVERLAAFGEPDGATRLEMTIAATPEGSASALEVLAALAGNEAARRPEVRVHRERLYHADGEPIGSEKE